MQTFSVFCQKSSSRIAKTEMYVSTRELGRKKICWKICVCAILFSEMSQKLLALWRKFFGSVVKTAFDVSIISKWEIFFEKSQILFGILAHWANPFRHSVEDFWAGLLENTILFFNHFRILSEQFPLFWRKKAVVLSKPLSTCLQEQFEINNFLKKNLSFFYLFRKQSEQKFGFSQFFSNGVAESLLFVSIGTFALKNIFF